MCRRTVVEDECGFETTIGWYGERYRVVVVCVQFETPRGFADAKVPSRKPKLRWARRFKERTSDFFGQVSSRWLVGVCFGVDLEENHAVGVANAC